MAETGPTYPRFVQLVSHEDYLYALDEAGQVWWLSSYTAAQPVWTCMEASRA